jgi:hypothetical protein
MRGQNGETGSGLLARGEVDEAKDAVMRLVVNNGQFTKIFIERYENPLFRVSASEDCVVAGVLGPIAGPIDIVSGGAKIVGSFTPDAGVEKQLHTAAPAAIVSGSMRSLATWRRAYTKQAWMSAFSSQG